MPIRLPSCSCLIVALLLALMGAPLVSCDKRPQASGASQPNGAPRIAVLSPAAAITLKDLGLAPLVVARHSYDVALEPRVPVAGDMNGIDYEALVAAKPTHVVIQWGTRDLPARLSDLAGSQQWRIVRYDPLSLRQVAEATKALHLEFASTLDELRAAQFDARFAELLDENTRPAPRRRIGSILLVASTNPINVLGPGSWHHELLERVGGIPAISQGKPWIKLDPEDVAALAPGGVILVLPAGPNAPSRGVRNFARDFDPAELAQHLQAFGNLQIPALQRGFVAIIDDTGALMPSTSLLGVADRMRAILDAWEAEAR